MMTTIDQPLIDFLLNDFISPEIGNFVLAFISLTMATLLSGLIGYEREYHGHSAGLRTHILVALGSALIMFLSIYGFGPVSETRDPARLAAQVITGVGFIGAGTIIQNGFDIKGLTTATTLWLVMAIGLAAGSGQFILATLGTAVALFALIMLRRFEAYVNRKAPKIFILVRGNQPVLNTVHETARRVRVTIKQIESQMTTHQQQKVLRVTLTLSKINQSTALLFLQELRQIIDPIDITTSFHVSE